MEDGFFMFEKYINKKNKLLNGWNENAIDRMTKMSSSFLKSICIDYYRYSSLVSFTYNIRNTFD
jgi:hypothetical protein